MNTLNVRAFMQVLMNLTDTNILSTPQVLAADNQKAKIVVGENRPFPTGQAQGITGGTQVTIERKDVGVTLELTPQVLEDDLIRLDIKHEITAIAENVAQTIGGGTGVTPLAVGPTTTKRSMETTTIAHDEQTLVIGGLVRDNITISERKVPFFGDIPMLGWLFRSQNRSVEKLNLLVLLTPHLVRDEMDMVELNARKAKEINTLQRDNRIEEPTRLKQDVLERLERPAPLPAPLSEPSGLPLDELLEREAGARLRPLYAGRPSPARGTGRTGPSAILRHGRRIGRRAAEIYPRRGRPRVPEPGHGHARAPPAPA